MDRALMTQLVEWKDSKRRKPLILNGARQVGKTWLLKQFGSRYFENVAYVSLDNNPIARSYFDAGYDMRRIISSLSLQLDVDIKPGGTLIVLDEVQACPKAITSLKYFCEDAPEYAVVAAGSLLGISATEGTGFPVGKVNMLSLYPLSFAEFLHAIGNERYAQVIASGDQTMMDSFSQKYAELLKLYYVVGGMPDAVNAFVDDGSVKAAQSVQREILDGYVRDFAKHIPSRLLTRTMLAWESLPKHLSKENRKFIFGQVRKGSRAADFDESLQWLEQAGLIHKVPRISRPGIPLPAYCDPNALKVFLLDVGLLGAMSNLEPEVVLSGNRIFTEFKGALTEQYVCQELVATGFTPYYWSAENSRGEIDFLVQSKGAIYPIEVKAEENLKAKSLAAFNQKYEGMSPRRFSLSGFRDQGWMRNVPLFAIGAYKNWA